MGGMVICQRRGRPRCAGYRCLREETTGHYRGGARERLRKLTGKEEGGSSSRYVRSLLKGFAHLPEMTFRSIFLLQVWESAERRWGAVDDLVDMYLQEAEERKNTAHDRMEDEEGDIMAAFSVSRQQCAFSMFMNAMDQVNSAADGDEDEIELIMAHARDAALLDKRHGSPKHAQAFHHHHHLLLLLLPPPRLDHNLFDDDDDSYYESSEDERRRRKNQSLERRERKERKRKRKKGRGRS